MAKKPSWNYRSKKYQNMRKRLKRTENGPYILFLCVDHEFKASFSFGPRLDHTK